MRSGRAAVVVLFLAIFSVFLMQGRIFAYDEEDDEGDFYEPARGPIPIRNQMPLYLFYLQLAPDKASVVERNRFLINTDYTVSSITVSAFTPTSDIMITPEYEIDIDLEVSRLTLDFRYGLYDNLEIGLEIPYISLSSGYLDNSIETFEDGIGARTPRSREHQGSYNFDYKIKHNGSYLVNEMDHQEGLGDIVLNTKYQLTRESWYSIWPNLSLRGAVKFPTAREGDLIGSGHFDYGVGVLLDKSFFKRFFIYMGANAMRIEKPDALDEFGIDNELYSYLLAFEFFFTKRFSTIVQFTGNTTPYPQSNTNPLDNDAHDWLLGFNYRLKERSNISWNFAVVENISAASSPDVSFHTGLGIEF